MARHTTRMGLLTMAARSARTAMRPGSAGLVERAAAVPRMLGAVLRGEYRGTTYGHVALLAAAVAYIVSPLDIVPEALFGVFGIADDAVVVTWLAAALVADTEAFLDWERGAARTTRTARPSGTAGYAGYAGAAGHGEYAGASSGSWGAGGPQDLTAEEYHRTVRSRVVR